MIPAAVALAVVAIVFGVFGASYSDTLLQNGLDDFKLYGVAAVTTILQAIIGARSSSVGAWMVSTVSSRRREQAGSVARVLPLLVLASAIQAPCLASGPILTACLYIYVDMADAMYMSMPWQMRL